MTRLSYARVSPAEQETALQLRDLEADGCERIQVQQLLLRRQLRKAGSPPYVKWWLLVHLSYEQPATRRRETH